MSLSSETLHASCIAREGRAVLISGRSGSGKSDLALRLVDRGAALVSDDYTIVRRIGGKLVARAPDTIRGMIEVRGIGLVAMAPEAEAEVALLVDLGREPERLPMEGETISIAGVKVPVLGLNGLEASAPIKVELALARTGTPLK